MTSTIFRYFPSLSEEQKEKFSKLQSVYSTWNSMINVISRRDMENFEIHHVLHSLSIARIISFQPGTCILDVGTGGGFPGIPLAILFPDSEFSLLDSIEKKLKVVSEVKNVVDLKNVTTIRKRAEEETGKYDFVISRAVMEFRAFVKITLKNISPFSNNSLKNGILYLKGGDLTGELASFRNKVKVWEIRDYFDEPFFETKKIVHLPC